MTEVLEPTLTTVLPVITPITHEAGIPRFTDKKRTRDDDDLLRITGDSSCEGVESRHSSLSPAGATSSSKNDFSDGGKDFGRAHTLH